MPASGKRVTAVCRLCRLRHNRHSFAVHRLTAWFRQGADLNRIAFNFQVGLHSCHAHAVSGLLSLLAVAGQLNRRISKLNVDRREVRLEKDLSAPTDGNEKATLVPKSPNPSKLCQPALKTPVVCSGSEQLLRLLTQHCAWVGAQVFDAIFGEPALDLGEGVTVLFWMLILVLHPRLTPCRLTLPVAQHRIARDESVSREPRDEASGPERNTCECVVNAENNHPARTCKTHDASECRTRIWSVVQNPRRIDHVESTRPQAWIVQVHFDELYLIESETSGRRGG